MDDDDDDDDDDDSPPAGLDRDFCSVRVFQPVLFKLMLDSAKMLNETLMWTSGPRRSSGY